MEDDLNSNSISSPSFKFHWDVFLSFSGDGEDTFINRLYTELVNNSIRTFRYEDELDRGDEFDPSLFTTIKDSALSIAVISRKYANSTRCLDGLVKILECRRLVLPVFYQVDPSDVRRQRGPFEEDFRSHERVFGENSVRVSRWKKAMEKVGNLSGWDTKNWKEPKLIQDLVEKILSKLSNIPLEVAKHPTSGLHTRVEEVIRKLDVKSSGVRILGLRGMGGIGKTTLAKAVYNKIVAQFEHRIFISNIGSTSKPHDGLISLQNEFIRDLCKINSPVDEVSKGIRVIREGIQEKRVLVVLDDVDDERQLDALAVKRDWFCAGSRIIITTRDNNVLMPQLVNEIYEVKELNDTESLQLFSYHAFGRGKPTDTYMHLSSKFVSCMKGLPLALEVVGAFMFDKRRIVEWEDELAKLKKISPGDLHAVLKLSFDGLDKEEKRVFLDIACFFVEMGVKRESAIDILKGCGFNADIAITVLPSKSLIRILSDGTFWMHDQLRDMGRQIVREECLEDPGMRSRLWEPDEILSILKYEKGSERIEGIILDFNKSGIEFLSSKEVSELTNRRSPNIVGYLMGKFKNPSDREAKKEKAVKLCSKPFAPMANLRLLQINHVNLEGKFKYIPGQLKWLQWKGCPLEALPSDFCPLELAVLDLTGSKIKQLWDRSSTSVHKMAAKLKVLDLRGCYNLTVSPDFTGHQHLEKLILENCVNLSGIHKSIGDVSTLRILNLTNCSKLVEFPNDISGLICLEILILSRCSGLQELPENMRSLKSLKELYVDGTAITKVPDSIFHLVKLEMFILDGCVSLERLPNSIGKLVSLRELSLNDCALMEIPDSIESLTNLETLSLVKCCSLDTIPDSIGKLESLVKLLLNGSSIKELPASIGLLSHLMYLSVGSSQFINNLPASIGGLASMVDLQLDGTSIVELPDEIGTLNLLKKLEMRNCKSLSRLPDTIGNIFNLTRLVLVNSNITELPESIGLLENLERLNVNQCRHLNRLPASIGNLKCLWEFLMEETGVTELPEEFGMLSSLMVLKMAKSRHLEQPQNMGEHTELTVLNGQESSNLILPASFSRLSCLEILDAHSCKISGIIPEEFGKLSSLEHLNLSHNNFCSLPSSLRGLSILKELLLTNCAELKSLPPLPSSLTTVNVANCTGLESISDLSNLEYLEELHLTNCNKVKDVPGLERLKSLKRLNMSGCTECCSVVKGRLRKAALRRFHNFSVPGSEIPDWFDREVTSFSSRKNSEIKYVIICVVVSLDQQKQDGFRDHLPGIVDITANLIRENTNKFSTALILGGVPKTDVDQVYFCRYPNCYPLVSMLEDGDKIQVTMRDPPLFNGLKLKKYGIHLVFEDDDDYDDDEETLDESEQSVSQRLTKFFTSTERGPAHGSEADSGEIVMSDSKGKKIKPRKSSFITRCCCS